MSDPFWSHVEDIDIYPHERNTMTAPVTTTTSTATTTSSQTKLSSMVQTVAFDVAGLGLIGAGIYTAITGKGTSAEVTLFSLGGAYLGVKVANATN